MLLWGRRAEKKQVDNVHIAIATNENEASDASYFRRERQNAASSSSHGLLERASVLTMMSEEEYDILSNYDQPDPISL